MKILLIILSYVAVIFNVFCAANFYISFLLFILYFLWFIVTVLLIDELKLWLKR